MKVQAVTDVGRERSVNQDYVYYSLTETGSLPNLFLVADGMGGHKAGDMASRYTVETFVSLVQDSTLKDPVSIINNAVTQVNRRLLQKAAESENYEGKGTTPEYTLRYLLSSAGLNPDSDVTIEFKSEAAEVAAVMANAGTEEVIAMLPQPYAATVLMQQPDTRIALDVTEEWEKLNGSDSTVVTGVLVVNTEFYKNNRQAVDDFLKEYKSSVQYVNSNVDGAAQLVEDFDIFKAAVAKKAIPKCNITLITGQEMQDKVEKYLKVLCDANPNAVGGQMPDDGFYVK